MCLHVCVCACVCVCVCVCTRTHTHSCTHTHTYAHTLSTQRGVFQCQQTNYNSIGVHTLTAKMREHYRCSQTPRGAPSETSTMPTQKSAHKAHSSREGGNPTHSVHHTHATRPLASLAMQLQQQMRRVHAHAVKQKGDVHFGWKLGARVQRSTHSRMRKHHECGNRPCCTHAWTYAGVYTTESDDALGTRVHGMHMLCCARSQIVACRNYI